MNLKILYIAHRVPYPPNKGEKIRSFNMLKYLDGLADVYLVALADDPRDLEHHNALQDYCRQVHLFPLSAKKKKLTALRGLLIGKPMSVLYFHEPRAQKAVDKLLATHDFNAVICFSSSTAEYIFRSDIFKRPEKRPRSRLIMDFCDVDSVKWKAYAKKRKGIFTYLFKREHELLGPYERQVTKAFDHSLFVSASEAALFEGLNPGCDNVRVVGNGVDMVYYRPPKDNAAQTPNEPVIIFCGAMDYQANVDGVEWFIQNVWQSILKAVPEAIFIIVGSNPKKMVKGWHNDRDIQVTGFVPDIRPYYSQAQVFVAPLRIARGVQNKVLIAMSMGVPTVCTPAAFEGIVAKPGHDLLVAKTEADFAHKVINLLQNQDHRNTLGKNARTCIEKNYSWNKMLAPILELIGRQT